MALESFKRVQALRVERNRLFAELGDRTRGDISRIIKDIGDEFVNFLSQEGFRVTRLKNAISAVYGDARLSLEWSPLAEDLSDSITVLSLLDSRNTQGKWQLAVVGRTDAAARSSGHQNGHSTLEETIESLRADINRFFPAEYQIRYRMVDMVGELMPDQPTLSAPSIRELLTEVLESPTFNH